MTQQIFEKKGRYVLLLTLIILAATALRLYNIDSVGLWNDESLSLRETQGLVWGHTPNGVEFTKAKMDSQNTFYNVLWSNIRGDSGNGILYTFTLKAWVSAFGTSDFSVRGLSTLFGLLVVLLGSVIALNIFKSKPKAIVVTLILALHPLLIDYSQEARPYMMATFFSLAATMLFIKIIRLQSYSTRWVLLYGLLSGIALLTHYLCVYIFMAHFIFALVASIKRNQWLMLISGGVICSIVLAGWLFNGGLDGLSYIESQNEAYQTYTSQQESSNYYSPATVGNCAKGIVQVLLSSSGNLLQNAGIQLRFLLVLLAIPFAVLVFVQKTKTHLSKGNILLTFLFLSSPIFATLLAFQSGHTISYSINYSIFSAPYFAFLLTQGLFTKKKKLLIVASSLGVLVMLGSIPTVYWSSVNHEVKKMNG